MSAPDWSAWLLGRLQGLSAAPSAGTCPDIPDLALTLHPDLALTLHPGLALTLQKDAYSLEEKL